MRYSRKNLRMTNTTHEIIIRSKNFELAPDVERYVQHLKDNGTLEKPANENKLTVEELQKSLLGKMCDIFIDNIDQDVEPRDVVIFFILATLKFLKDK